MHVLIPKLDWEDNDEVADLMASDAGGEIQTACDKQKGASVGGITCNTPAGKAWR